MTANNRRPAHPGQKENEMAFDEWTLTELLIERRSLAEQLRDNTDRDTVHDRNLNLMRAEIDKRFAELHARQVEEEERKFDRENRCPGDPPRFWGEMPPLPRRLR